MAADVYLKDTIAKHFKLVPTACQERLFAVLSSFVMQSDSRIMLVNGYAGTGKTTAMSAFISAISEFNVPCVLLAPTGRSAKVLSNYSGRRAYTIHKHIYRQKKLTSGIGEFELNLNKSRDTIFIVDESSLITCSSLEGNIFGSGDLLQDLYEFVSSGPGCKLILVGDNAQLPPIGLEKSPALDIEYVESKFGKAFSCILKTVVRQAQESGILYNATLMRRIIEGGEPEMPHFKTDGYADVERIGGGDLIEKITDAYDKYGQDETVILCRSNKRANRYNAGIRSTVLYREEQLCVGDKVMVVKNCYQFLENVEDLDFIANGDIAELKKIGHYEDRYGLHFADADLEFPDYNNVEIKAKIILDTLTSETASLSREQSEALYQGVDADYADIKSKSKRYKQVREDHYFNALQLKYAAAITCHKSQGGQWKCVFIDNSFFGDFTMDDLKWLYTAMTRAVEKVYLVNFPKSFFES
jgi:exodeoxyribonuclease-5